MQGMIEMAADKETFLVPAPPPPLLKPPPRGGGGGAGGGDVPLVQLRQGAAPAEQPQEDAQAQPAAAAAGGPREDTASPLRPSARLNQGAAPAHDSLPPQPPVQRRPPPKGGGSSAAAAVEEGEDSVSELQRPRNGFQPPPPPPHHQPRAPGGGKRRSSCNAGGGFKHPAFKRRRRINSESDPVLPSEFLLGGNIFDPLNLNSLLDEDVNQAVNAETPKSSPLPAKGRDPVEILIPKDITDPLSLNNAQEDHPVLAAPVKPGRKRHRHRGAQRGTAGLEGGGGGTGGGKPPLPASCKGCQKTCNGATPQPYELNTAINCRDEVVSPLLPATGEAQPGQQASGCATPSGTSVASWTAGGSSSRHHHHRKRRRTSSKSEGGGGGGGRHSGASTSSEQPCRSSPDRGHSVPRGRHPQAASGQPVRQQPPRHKFQYGNYCKYYGYRNPNCEDLRLRVMKPEWFQGKEVLDVGCNVGHLTLSVAKKWGPARIVGVDIDGALIHSARQNIRHYLSEEMREEQQRGQDGGGSSEGASRAKKTFPASLMASRGPIAAPRVPQDGVDATVFPNNVFFVQGNYVLEQDELLEAQKPEYDVILCLSLTKWVHLNWGDEGLKRLFKRFYRHLHPGGILILEPQAWSSYGKRKNLTETMCRHYYRIQLKPDQFPSYLTSPEVGFCSYELVATPRSTSKGFQRPIYLFHKAGPGAH
ncbi:7SK snRNA methylphosphate capping enzyme [Zootoca vivipara]|uniref:7SK snRNA methylphosphate capping enzyme n=1 Tax=Zootoca vivipara TaxID=8524 RepID=UPI00293BD4A5|nr:7SK snRNA methylphosphate capping enzyme [Zootoca vivipara]